VVFAAGAMVGMVGQRATAKTADVPTINSVRGHSRLTEELQLNVDQQSKIQAIWSAAVVKAGPPPTERVRALEKDREQAILSLLSDNEKTRYNQVIADYRQKLDALHQPARTAFTEAEEQTKPLLNPTQLAKYEEIIKRRPHRRNSPVPLGPTTLPATAPIALAR
jgi:hypothetical protein